MSHGLLAYFYIRISKVSNLSSISSDGEQYTEQKTSYLFSYSVKIATMSLDTKRVMVLRIDLIRIAALGLSEPATVVKPLGMYLGHFVRNGVRFIDRCHDMPLAE